MTELTKFILQGLEANGWDTSPVYDSFHHSPFKAVISFEGFKRKVRKVREHYVPDLYRASEVPKGFLVNQEPFRPQTVFEENGNEATLDFRTDRITTLEQLLLACQVDQKIWKVERHTVNKWEMGAVLDGKPVVTPLFQVKANLIRRKLEDPVIPVIQPLKLEYKPRRILPSGTAVQRYLILGDAQIGFNRNMETGELTGYHDEAALAVALKMAATFDFEEIIVLGDMLDMTEMSKYVQKPEFQQTLQPAINYLGEFFLDLRGVADTSRIVYLCGNHEDRLQKQLLENFKFAYGLKAFGDRVPFYSLRRLLDLDSVEVELIEDYPSGQHWIADDLVVVHGEYVKLSTVSSNSNVSTIMGHLHHEETLTKTYHERDSQRIVKAVTCGCLCRIDGTVPGVTARPSWQNGLIVVERSQGITNINHVSIQGGRANYGGYFFDGTK